MLMILSYLNNTVDNRYPTDKILKRTTKMHPFKQQYLQGAVNLNRRSVMRHQLPQNVLDLPQQCLFNRCSILKQVTIFETGNITPVNIFASTSSVTTKNYVILMLHSRPLAKFNHDLIYAFGDWLQATVNRLTVNS